MPTFELKGHCVPLFLASTALLSACSPSNNAPPTEPTATMAAVPSDETPAVTNAPLSREQVSIALELLGAPMYDASDDTVNMKVKLSNNGASILPANGKHNVLLGLVQLEPSSDTRGAADARALLKSDVPPGSSTEVEVKVPAGFAADYKVQLEPLQEGVAWFGFDFQQPVLVVGPFKRCDGNPQSLCNADNSALAAK